MALLDLVEYLDPTGNVLVARVPSEGSGELRFGSQCVVREGQRAFLCRDGHYLDMFSPGRHMITTKNIPLLINLIKLPFGNKSPFRADVYYVNLHQHLDLKWGTPQPIPMRDTQFGMVRIRAFGTYVAQVADPRKLLTKIVGTRGRLMIQEMEDQLRSSIIARLADVIAERMQERKLSVIDLAIEYNELSEIAHESLKPDFAELGLNLSRFYINTISVPEELERRFDQAGGVAAMGGLDNYTRYKAAEALQDAAQNGGDGLAGAGVGLGVGMNLGTVMGQALNSRTVQPQTSPQTPQPAATTLTCGSCGTSVVAPAKFCSECGQALQPAPCPGCSHKNPPTAKFCSECGYKLQS
ncbi:MAG: putative transmembrane protein [Chloroflexi bacterium AL-W]|nr:putative transmembrane protein [Chloroflexi bacterium AL-N1]NOK70512.1 putative transmembrane protein [Chloroflexi bacterium AL-N10]NOK78129.1 putative transmembrane protein [Chloroflexi bacterium AL-N5]NOK85228.1 putative transmembrane protein [Chloroflexi bacterium AL-W]NOK91993.1 putative transmembrane protein [Chloroflexi bacterium AL-N15]